MGEKSSFSGIALRSDCIKHFIFLNLKRHTEQVLGFGRLRDLITLCESHEDIIELF